VFEIKHLLTLQTVAKLGSFVAAANALNFTPSAISQQIGALERTAGATLFERGHGGTRLTEAGESLLLHAEVVLARLSLAELELEAIADRRGGRLRMGSFTSATATFAAEALERFREQHPAVALKFFDGEPYESAAGLKARELDLAVVFDLDVWATGTAYDGRLVCGDDELACVGLFDDPFLLVMRRDHALASGGAVTVEDLQDETIIGSAPWIDALAASWEASPARPHVDSSCRATGFEAFQALVAAGRGLTLMPRLALGWLRDDLIARPLEGAPVRHVKAATPAGAFRSPATVAMLELLVDFSGAHREQVPSPGSPSGADHDLKASAA
jgi:DNA-binding transcriptional LysR family regulator